MPTQSGGKKQACGLAASPTTPCSNSSYKGDICKAAHNKLGTLLHPHHVGDSYIGGKQQPQLAWRRTMRHRNTKCDNELALL